MSKEMATILSSLMKAANFCSDEMDAAENKTERTFLNSELILTDLSAIIFHSEYERVRVGHN
jgi:hypothetical protein